MAKKTVLLICLIAGVSSLYASTNARNYALGQAYFVGDILNIVPQPWQLLLYPDRIQGGRDLEGGKPGPAVGILSLLNNNAAIGISMNTFDKRSPGSNILSPFYSRAKDFALLNSPSFITNEFPNYPTLGLACKIGKQKFGINGFYQVNNFKDSKNVPGESNSIKEGSITAVGGSLSARLGFGNLGWNPWGRVGLPILSAKQTSLQFTTDTTTSIETTVNENREWKNADGGGNLMYSIGSCFDYTFGNWGWGIIGAWYRNEQYKFVNSYSRDTSRSDNYHSAAYTDQSFSPKYNHDYFDYFASITPKIFDNTLIALEYQGAYYRNKSSYEDQIKKDTSNAQWINQFIFAIEKQIECHRWINKFTYRGSLRYNVGQKMEKTEIAEDLLNPNVISVEEHWSPILTKDDVTGLEGMMLFVGCGVTFKKCTLDLATNIKEWSSQMFMGPPPAEFTLTYNFH